MRIGMCCVAVLMVTMEWTAHAGEVGNNSSLAPFTPNAQISNVESIQEKEALSIAHDDTSSKAFPSPLREQSRLVPYNHNTVAFYQRTKGDQYAMEVNYSFRYLFTRPDCYYEVENEHKTCIDGWNKRLEFYFAYTGKFDFYVGGTDERASGPVINRISNPAFHWRLYQPDLFTLHWIDFGIEHRSNGQTTSAGLQDAAGNYIANNEWKAGHRAYIDGISRGSNYFSLEGRDSAHLDKTEIKYWLSGKAYFPKPESDVT
ncbi:MAG: hypothetical protein PXX77_06375, partial [Gallionella sp.]|nr:hypothetical protein [Gallionella sp.]